MFQGEESQMCKQMSNTHPNTAQQRCNSDDPCATCAGHISLSTQHKQWNPKQLTYCAKNVMRAGFDGDFRRHNSRTLCGPYCALPQGLRPRDSDLDLTHVTSDPVRSLLLCGTKHIPRRRSPSISSLQFQP